MGLVAALVGATGLIGSQVLDALLADPAYEKIVALVRRPHDPASPKLIQAVVDFRQLSHAPVWDEVGRVDVLFCCLGTTIKTAGSRAAFREVDSVYPMQFAEAGLRAGARHYLLVSSVGADAEASSFYLRVKGELERDLRATGFPALSIFRPSLLLGPRTEKRTGERIAQVIYPAFNPLLVAGLRKYRAIEARTVALAMVRRGAGPEQGTAVLSYDEIVAWAQTGVVAGGSSLG